MFGNRNWRSIKREAGFTRSIERDVKKNEQSGKTPD